jgi:capsule polysaccharide export protein KpsC/LpsZ
VSAARLPEKFLYFPLHFQPEASTSARGRHYVELREVVASLASSMPNDVMLVIKEHPHQYEKLLPRPPGFFASLMALPKVHLVESSMPSAKLRKLSLGVVTVSGSNGFEVLATGKQVIAFGSAAWREAPGVWNVRSQADIESAVASMCTKLTRDRSEYLPFIARLKSATFLADYSDSRKGRTHQEDELLCRATRTNTLLVVQAWLRGLTSS